MTLSVPTLRDNILEGNEQFKATLSLTFGPSNVIIGSPHMAFVTITDTTGMCLICVVNVCLNCQYFYAIIIIIQLKSSSLPFSQDSSAVQSIHLPCEGRSGQQCCYHIASACSPF